MDAEPKQRRTRAQIAKDERAIVKITELVRNSQRYDFKHLQNAFDCIADELVTAGRVDIDRAPRAADVSDIDPDDIPF